jgi:hypothetical protein
VALASPITRDLAIDGGGLTAVGIGGVVAAAALVKGGPGLAIIPFVIVALVFGLAQVVVSGGWLRNAVADAGPAPAGLVLEPDSTTLRRAGLPTLLALVLIVIALFVWVQFAALLAGLAFAAGMMDLRSRAWISRLQDDRGVVILRETTWLPFATSRRSLWTRERSSD